MSEPRFEFDVPESELPKINAKGGKWISLVKRLLIEHKKNLVIEFGGASEANKAYRAIRRNVNLLGEQDKLEVHIRGLNVVVMRKEAQK